MRSMRLLQYALLVLLTQAAGAVDCRNAIAPQRCELGRLDQATCADLPPAGRSACELELVPDLLCRGSNITYCNALVSAQTLCDRLQGSPRRTCVRGHLPFRCNPAQYEPNCTGFAPELIEQPAALP